MEEGVTVQNDQLKYIHGAVLSLPAARHISLCSRLPIGLFIFSSYLVFVPGTPAPTPWI